MASSPHGSKTWEVIRSWAIRLLSDQQRKKIKSLLVRIGQIPVKAAGIHHYIEDQKSELERLKSKVTLLEARQNLAQYGLPLSTTFQVEALSESISISLEQGVHNTELEFLKQHDSIDRLKLAQAIHSALKIQSPRALTLGGDALPFLKQLSVSEWIGFEGAEAVYQNAREQMPAIRWELADPISGLWAYRAKKFDLIVCTRKYLHLSPPEQRQFIRIASEALNPGGVLAIELPDLAQPRVVSDLYWEDPRNLRLYSLSQLQASLSAANFRVSQPLALPSQRIAILAERA